MSKKYAINGLGRIGRNILRSHLANPKFELVAVNDLADTETLAHLLKYDSVHGNLPYDIKATDGGIIVDGKKITVYQERNPEELPWGEIGADVVMECTGVFATKEKASTHLKAGAKKVIVSAPCAGADITLVCGVNTDTYDTSKHDVISNGSCTTNCLAPVVKVVLDNFGIEKGMMTTIHSYTNDQRILDLPHKDLRRARAAALSMIPTTTGAAKAISLVIPEMAGKLDGMSIRVPTPNVSVVDFVAELSKPTSKEEVNSALEAAVNGPMKDILGFCTEPLVSSDFNGSTESSIIDSIATMTNGNMVKIITWYDNETGFSTRMLDLAGIVFEKL